MRVGLTGATGLAGHAIAAHLRTVGHEVVTYGRAGNRTWQLGAPFDARGIDVVVHAAFSHVPGRYRGGEGDDPEGFLRTNLDGSLALVAAAPRVVFLSSRAVYGAFPPGTRLREDMAPRPDTLYGRMKRDVETAVIAAGGTALRATGLYGPPPDGRAHKWADLFAAFARGEAIAPRVATELHADDLASAVALVLAPGAPVLLNVSDIVLDRRDLLAAYARLTGLNGILPPRADAGAVNEMDTTALRALGWRPRGRAGLDPALARMGAAAP